jgi:acyl carrier protein
MKMLHNRYPLAIMISMDFSDWITRKYIEWRGDAIGNTRTITEFADWIGVTQSVMSSWMKRGGRVPRHQQTISKLAARFGDEVYDVLGLERPEVSIPLDQLPASVRERLEAAIKEINAIFEERGVEADSPEAVRITVEVMDRFGFTLRETENE